MTERKKEHCWQSLLLYFAYDFPLNYINTCDVNDCVFVSKSNRFSWTTRNVSCSIDIRLINCIEPWTIQWHGYSLINSRCHLICGIVQPNVDAYFEKWRTYGWMHMNKFQNKHWIYRWLNHRTNQNGTRCLSPT